MKYLALIGSSTTIVEADSPDEVREHLLIQAGYLRDNKSGEARRHHFEEVRRTKPYLFENIVVRPATEDDLKRYAALADATTGRKTAPGRQGKKKRKTTSDRLFGEAS